MKYIYYSLKKDKSKSIFYWLAFTLTTFFIFAFFNLSMNEDSLINLGKDDPTLMTFLCTVVVGVSMFVVFFANDFFVKSKAKEISVYLVSGMTFFKLAVFLLSQNLIIMLCSIPLGLFLGVMSIPLQNQFLHSILMLDGEIVISLKGMIATFIILFVEILWCTILNMGYTYRSEIRELASSKINIEKIALVNIPQWLYIIFYFLPVFFIVFHDGEVAESFFFSMIGCIGVYGMIAKIIPQFIKKRQHKHLNNIEDLLAYGFLYNDLSSVSLMVVLYIAVMQIIVSIMAMSYNDMIQLMMSILSFGIIMFMIPLAIILKILNNVTLRKKEYTYLSYIGVNDQTIQKLVKKEMSIFYLYISCLSLLYFLSIIIKNTCIHSYMTLRLSLLLIGIFVMIFIINYVLTIYCYQRIIKN